MRRTSGTTKAYMHCIALVGTATFHSGSGGENAHPISIGQTLFVGEGQRHRVAAREDCAFLIIIGLQA